MADDKLGKYEIRGQLGRGAMGTVYDGWDPIIARRVAIKTVRLPDSADAEAQDELARFRREAQAAGRLTHPNIVGVFDYGETDAVAFIVMEFVDGRTLKSITDKDERLPLSEIARVMNDMLAGLQFSHERGVVHRDIKPANVMLTQQGQAKIADFGIARIESSSMTQAGTVLGTPAYMSPEQFMGQVVDLRTDIYSAGVLLYQLLTGERPFDGSMTAIMHKALNTVPPKPSELSVTCPKSFDAVVARAMAKRPEDRFASAKALADAITGALLAPASTTIAAPAQPASGATLPPASLDDLLDTEATMVAPRRPPGAPAPAKPDTPGGPASAAKRGGSGALIAIAAVVALAVLGGGGYVLFGGSGPTNVAAVTPPVTPPTPSVPVVPAQTPATTSGQGVAVSQPSTPPTPVPGPTPTAPVAAPAPPPTQSLPIPSTPSPTRPTATAQSQTAPVAAPTLPPSTPSPTRPTTTVQSQTAPAPAPPSSPIPSPTQPTTPSPIASAPAASAPRPLAPTGPGPAPVAPVAPLAATPPSAPPSLAQPPAASPGSSQFAAIVPAPGPNVAPTPVPVPATPPPLAPTTVEPARLSAAALRQAAAAVAAGASCSMVWADANDSGSTLTVGGVAGNAGMASLRQAFDLAAPGVDVAWQVTGFDGPYCPALDAIRTAPGRGTGLSITPNKTQLSDNELLILQATMPDYPAHLMVDYFGNDGTVTHIVPTTPDIADHSTPDKLYPARSRQRFGDPAPPRYDGLRVGPPFGTDMIVVIASQAPLISARTHQQEEQPARYVAELQGAIDAARRRGGKVSATAFLLTIGP